MGPEQGPLRRRSQPRFLHPVTGRQRLLHLRHQRVGIGTCLRQQTAARVGLGGGPQKVHGVQIGPVLGGTPAGRRQKLLRGIAEQAPDGHPLDRRR